MTEELQVVQTERERAERAAAEAAREPADSHTHERRAERSAYLREKLAERARSEDAASG